jgi:hypothetical protein
MAAAFGLIALAPVVINLAAWAIAGSPDRFELLDDDAYYYLGVAEHLAAGDGFTFNGLDPTNGFHPLWLAIVVPIEWLGGGRTATVGLVLLVQSAFWLATVRELWLTGRALGDPGVTLLAAIPLVFFAGANYRLAFNGMESSLVLLLLAAIVRQVVGWSDGEARPLLVGLLLAALALARLDAVFVVASLATAGWLCWRERPDRIRQVTLLAGPAALALAGYVLFNLLEFGTATPVSGQAKSLGAPFHNLRPVRDVLAMGSLGGHSLWTGAAALVTAFAAIRWGRRAPRGQPASVLRHLLAALLLAQGLLTLYLVVMTSWPTWPWYFYLLPYIWFCALLLLGLGRVPQRVTGRLAPASAALLAIVTTAFVVGWVRDPTYRSRSVVAAQALDAVSPRGAPVAMGDRAGAFSFGTERPVVQLEGLVESPEYLTALRRGRVGDFLNKRRVAFFAASDAEGVPTKVGAAPCRAFAEPHNGDGPKAQIVVCDRDLVANVNMSPWGRLRIWRYRPPG